jgi:hypothetical protein
MAYKIKSESVVGRVFQTNNSVDCVVVEYGGWDSVTVKFLDEYAAKVTTQMSNLKRGMVANPYSKSVNGVGYLGEGAFTSREVGNSRKTTLVYYIWSGMMDRGYCQKLKEKSPTYIDCTVCVEWHNFQVFAEWYTNHEFYDLGYQLDKDILVKGNKHYSPDTCCLVPAVVNAMFNTCGTRRGLYPLGVGFHSGKKSFYASVREENKLIHLGMFLTPELAFDAYKDSKEVLVKRLALEWEGKIERKVFNTLMFWTV